MINHKVLYYLLTLLAGLGLGYLVFGRKAGHAHEPAAAPAKAAQAATEYTCSMHPQIRQPEPGICPLCNMDLIPLDASSNTDPTVLEMTSEAIKLADIQTTLIGRGSVAGKRLLLSGKVQPDERRAASQVAHVPGRIEQLYVTYTGENVRQGQPLARLYSPQLVNAQKELLEAIRFKGKDSDLAEAARTRIRFWKVPETLIQEVENSGKIQKEITVRADRNGVVMARKVSVGDYVEEGMPLFELMDLNRVWVLFEAYEADLANIRPGIPIQFTTPAAPGRTFAARVTFIDPLIDPESRTASVRAEIDNPGGWLKPEMFVKGELLSVAQAQKGLIVPKTAVLWTGKRSVVYVKVPNMAVPSFQYREVELGAPSGNGYLVESGLETGEEVVTNGAFVIDAAAQLNNQQSMMNRMVSVAGQAKPAAPDFRADIPAVFRKQWTAVIDAYLGLKDALVETNPKKSLPFAGQMLQRLNAVEGLTLSGEAARFWQQQSGGMKANLKNIDNSQDVEEQRRQFFFLSELVIQTAKAIGGGETMLYVQHCPMAFNNQGGDWISAQREIRNPYFGDQMLTCGVVKDSVTLAFNRN